jgi:hypothetical protein
VSQEEVGLHTTMPLVGPATSPEILNEVTSRSTRRYTVKQANADLMDEASFMKR